MIVGGVDNSFAESSSTHSIGRQNALTIPSPGFDSNPLMVNQKSFWGGGQHKGISGLFDSGLDLTQWGIVEWVLVAIAIYGVVSFISDSKKNVKTFKRYRRRKQSQQLQEE